MIKYQIASWSMPVAAVGASLSYVSDHGWLTGVLSAALWAATGATWNQSWKAWRRNKSHAQLTHH